MRVFPSAPLPRLRVFAFRNAKRGSVLPPTRMSLAGRAALVTGGSRRIGKAIALALARAGADIAIGYREDVRAAQRTVASIETLGRRAFAVRADLTRGAECRRIVETAIRKLGRLDILVNNVGEWVVESVASMDAGTWRRILDSNLTATFLCSKYAVPHMRRRRWGRIVNLGAAGAYRAHGSARVSAFYAAKAGIVAFSKSLAREVGPFGITVNVVAPGVIDDPELPIADAGRRKDKRLAVPRVGTGEDVANAVLSLVPRKPSS